MARAPRPTVECVQCGITLKPGMTRYQKVSGFAKDRTAGGANGIALAEWHQEFLCRPCFDVRNRTGISWEQQSLFGGE